MKRNEPVTHIMTRNPVTVNLSMKPSEVRHIIANGGFHHVPVVSGADLYGIISSSDFLRLSWGAGDARGMDTILDHTVTLENIVVRDTVSLQKTDTIRRAAEILAEGRFHALPVLDGKELLGIVTTTDLIRYLLEQY